MGYASKGRKPIERASKIAHVEILKNPDVRAYVGQCVLPSAPNPESLDSMIEILGDVDSLGITAVIAVDGVLVPVSPSISEVAVVGMSVANPAGFDLEDALGRSELRPGEFL